MTDWKIPLYRIYTDEEDEKIVNKIIKRGNTWAIGEEIEKFEKKLSEFLDVKYCICILAG